MPGCVHVETNIPNSNPPREGIKSFEAEELLELISRHQMRSPHRGLFVSFNDDSWDQRQWLSTPLIATQITNQVGMTPGFDMRILTEKLALQSTIATESKSKSDQSWSKNE